MSNKSNHLQDTIAAVATPRGKGAISIIRVSGPRSAMVLELLWQGSKSTQDLTSSKLYSGWINIDGKRVDQALAVISRAPHSYTGEDVVEFHTHGSVGVVDQVLEAILGCDVRLAEPGEFSRRALLAGKLDMAQAEAVADLVEAESRTLVSLAADQLAGGLSAKISNLTKGILSLAAEEAAYLDFSEEDIEVQDQQGLVSRLDQFAAEAEHMINSSRNVTMLRDGVTVALVGLPNAGKSALLNTLVGYERAIVSSVAGTTRDTLDERIMISDIPVRLIDTAGLNTDPDLVEAIGIERTLQVLSTAEVVMVLIEPGKLKETEAYLDSFLTQPTTDRPVIALFTKLDIAESGRPSPKPPWASAKVDISTKPATNIDKLVALLGEIITNGQSMEGAMLTTRRQIELVTNAHDHSQRAKELLSQSAPRDILLVELEAAASELSKITGHDTSEAMLDDMFSRFCIGK